MEIGGYKQRALLAILLIERNRVVPVDRITDRLWNGYPPASAASTLQGYLSHLRKALHAPGEDRTSRLTTQGPGYVLWVDEGDVDADRFADLARAGAAALAHGDAYGACELLDQGLALWRGPALADFSSELFARDEQVRLEELHAQVTEDRMDAALTLGWHSRILPDLQTLVARHPLRERLRGQLMLSLYRCGRQVEALEVYRQGRQELAEELGIDPGPALQQLEEAILRQDASLDVPVAVGTPIQVAPDDAAAPPSGGQDLMAPPPHTRSANLVAPLSPIIGRGVEIDEVTALLGTSRLVTLTGPGGTGKTRLATEIAHRLAAADDEEGPWLIELAGLSESALVPNTVAQALHLVIQGDRAVPDLLADALGDRHALLVLDNCEHLLDAVAALAQTLLARCAGLRIMATSRESLKVPGETLYAVAPLPVADRTPEARMVDGDAMRLFEARAAAVVPGFTITAENRSVVRKICRELDGLPLAIELAAARLRVLSPEQLAEHLDDRFTLLAGGGRNAEPRQRALRTTVEWSFDLLNDAEQRLFTTLAVFSGGFELDAAAQLWDGSAVEALDLLDALVSKSLVSVDTSVHPRRYGMLQTLREYGRRLLGPDDRTALALRHARWCADLTSDGETALRGPSWMAWLRRLDSEHDNIRAAIGFSLDAAHQDLAAHIVAPLGWYWFRRGHIDEARQWLERCYALRNDAVSDPWSRVVMGLGTVRFLSGEVDEARRLGNEAIAVAQACDARFAEAQATVYSCYFEAITDLDGAQRRAERGLALVRQLGLPWLEAEAMITLGNIARGRGELERAEGLVLKGIEQAAQAGYWWQERMSRWTAAKVALDRGEPDVAIERLRGVTQDLVRAGDRAGALMALHALAAAVAGTKSAETGAVLLGAIAVYSERLGFFPERIDPVDARRMRDRIRQMLPDEDYEAAYERGRGLPREELEALVDQLAGV